MNFKNKLFGVALAASMITGTVVPAMAASITIENAPVGVQYSAYKIFNADHDANDTGTTYDGYAYTIENTSEWFSVVDTYAKTNNSGLTLTASTGHPSRFVVTFDNDKFDAPAFAAYLQSNIGEKTAAQTITAGTATNDSTEIEAKFTGLDRGYYLVKSGTGTESLAALITSADEVKIVDKNELGLTKGFASGRLEEFAAIGEDVTYKVTATVPYKSATAPSNTFRIIDYMPTGLTWNNDVAVTIGGDETYDFRFEAQALTGNDSEGNPLNGFYVDITINDNTKVGETIEIIYSGEVNNNINSVTETTNNGNTNRVEAVINGKTDSKTATFFTATKNILKINEQRQPLSGAIFTLQDLAGNYYSEVDGIVTWVPAANKPALNEDLIESSGIYRVTPDNGIITFKGLDADKNYTLIEVKAPTGYNLLTAPETISFKGTDTQYSKSGADLLVTSMDVTNLKGVQLPETGGMGTTLFYMVGGTLTAGAAVMLITKKRMSEAE